MASKQKLSKPTYGGAIGPTQSLQDFNPPNPSDTLRSAEMPVRRTPDQTIRMPFHYPTKSALHRNRGPSNEEINQPYFPCGVGEDQNKYASGPNDENTLEGQYIKGT